MKTPQEQANTIVNQLAIKLADYPKLLTNEYDLFVKEAIPLAELIAIALTAKQYAGLVSECCMTGDRTGEVCDLHCALEALRATRKVEL